MLTRVKSGGNDVNLRCASLSLLENQRVSCDRVSVSVIKMTSCSPALPRVVLFFRSFFLLLLVLCFVLLLLLLLLLNAAVLRSFLAGLRAVVELRCLCCCCCCCCCCWFPIRLFRICMEPLLLWLHQACSAMNVKDCRLFSSAQSSSSSSSSSSTSSSSFSLRYSSSVYAVAFISFLYVVAFVIVRKHASHRFLWFSQGRHCPSTGASTI